MQVSQPTNEQPLLQAEVNDLVSRINSKFGSLEYTPVVYLKQVPYELSTRPMRSRSFRP